MIHIMLPAQYPGRVRPADPHKRLMAAVLHAVIDDCRGCGKENVIGAGSARKAVAYVASTDRTWPFSFENLCEALELDAAALRRELVATCDAV